MLPRNGTFGRSGVVTRESIRLVLRGLSNLEVEDQQKQRGPGLTGLHLSRMGVGIFELAGAALEWAVRSWCPKGTSVGPCCPPCWRPLTSATYASDHDVKSPEDYHLRRMLLGVPEGSEEIVPGSALPLESCMDVHGGGETSLEPSLCIC